MRGKGISNQTLREAYSEFRNIAKVAEVLGLNPSSVHERLQRLGIATPPSHLKFLTDDDRERLKADYVVHAENGTLDVLAKEMGRTKYLLAREARKLGLTSPQGRGRRKNYVAVWKYMDETQASLLWEEFKKQPTGVVRFCLKRGFDDLGFSRTMQKFFPEEWEAAMELKVSKQSPYRLGRAVEYRVRDHMRKLGYFVMRSPASKSPIDLVAVRKGEVIFIQCKRSGALRPAEWNEFFQLCNSVGAIPIMATMHSSGRGSSYFRLLGEKDGSKHRQPLEPFTPGDVEPELFKLGVKQ